MTATIGAVRPAAETVADTILSDALTVGALRHLGGVALAAGYASNIEDAAQDADLVSLITGEAVEPDVASGLLGGPECLAACLASGVAICDGEGRIRLGCSLLVGLDTLAIEPSAHQPGSRVYSGPDTWILLEKAWRFGLGGGRAVDLGTGTGLVAAFLTSRYDHVTATDLTPSSVATAAVARELLDPVRRSRMSVLRTDIGHGLPDHAFDLVVSNAPWVPSSAAGGEVCADGGPTGQELSLRFLSEAVRLLAPTGVVVLLCADLRFDDGRSPLAEALSRLRSLGYATEVEVTPGQGSFSFVDPVPNELEGLVSGRHVTVIVHRPSLTPSRH